ncbi:flagellar hook-associated protein FlgL [Desulfocurvus sp.]|jgi:flagellar hook-associated protein 3 FlgL|uniref:flagellar hook-associated protein FlgL n=1 Tax=Desulfocurvus sp. TaxID=2871698 RepID=UPI0025B9975E|nr:flagellar hook-associated protein FlgL [Desulfocurvus sp.]MCK9239180.1 flagellar hook-associated protein FlgL [Desulfocurvus sp.]
MRVTHSNRFNLYIGNLNSSLADLMELNIQSATQKVINKPSDNPVGMARVLGHRDTISALDQYRKNVSTAKGWLSLADNKLTRMEEILTRLRTLAEQSATGTVSADNREQISYEARQLYEELVVLANTQYEDKYIFSGHKTDTKSYEQALWLTDNDGSTAGTNFTITGATQKTVLVRFTSAGTVGTDALTYEYSADGGQTFATGTLAAGATQLDLGSVQLGLQAGTAVTQHDPSVSGSNGNGTWLWVRPTAVYQGDDNDAVTVDKLGASSLNVAASGLFDRNITVRIDNDTTLGGNPVRYSYSTDGGANWVTGLSTDGSGDPANLTLVVPGGTMTLSDSGGGNLLAAGQQFVIRPRTANISLEVAPGESLPINSVGKDIFGGIYADPSTGTPGLVSGLPDGVNMFDQIGKLVGYLETNNQQGCQEALAAITPIGQHLMNSAARVGALENRLAVADGVLETMQLNEKERMSEVEDADLAELMTKLANQQIVYETVLRSSSMVMRLSLANFM